MITPEQLKAILPHASLKTIDELIEPMLEALWAYKINTKQRIASFIAQVGHESGSFKYMEEIASGSAYDMRADLGNLHPQALAVAKERGTTTGKLYKGRGLIQVTGFYNYKDCGKALELDLINHPELLKEPRYACRSAAWFWNTRSLNDLADVGRQKDICRKVNGGYNGLHERLAIYEKAMQVLP